MSVAENSVNLADSTTAIHSLDNHSVHLILSDIPYGISAASWDVLHHNTNSALLGASPAQTAAGTVFRSRGKPLNGWSQADRQIPQEYQDWCSTFARQWLRLLTPGGSALVFAGRRLAHRCIVALEDAGFTFKDSLAWIKRSAPHRAQRVSSVLLRRGDKDNAEKWKGWRVGNLRPIYEPILWFVKPYPIGTTVTDNIVRNKVGGYNEEAFIAYEGFPNNILNSSFKSREPRHHAAQKPTTLLEALIVLTTVKGQLVLDPFCGSGSTLVAAKRTGRRYIGFDNDPECVRVAKQRLDLSTEPNEMSLWGNQ